MERRSGSFGAVVTYQWDVMRSGRFIGSRGEGVMVCWRDILLIWYIVYGWDDVTPHLGDVAACWADVISLQR